jgi:hypothetical protein
MATEKLIYASAARKAILKEDPKLAYCIDSIPGVDAVEVDEYEAIVNKLECLLCHATGGKYSKAGYSWEDMERMVTDYIEECCEEAVAEEVVRCKDCKHWHEETSWCTKHSHFVGFDGMACHPSQSSEWKMFDADDFCSYGERRTDV